MINELEGKVAVVTGASQGIGQECVKTLAEAGADIAFTYGRNHEAAQQTAAMVKDAGRRVLFEPVDAADSQATETFMKKVMDEFGRVDVMVNNVGGADTLPKTGFADMPLEYWHSQFDKNFFSAVYYSRLAVKSMIANKGGSIINIGSVHASRVINLDVMPYACSKQALNNLTRFLAVELAKHNIRVNCISPGLIRTPLTESRYDEDWWNSITTTIPLGRAGKVTEVAELALLLASEKCGYMTGQIIGVDGGRSL